MIESYFNIPKFNCMTPTVCWLIIVTAEAIMFINYSRDSMHDCNRCVYCDTVHYIYHKADTTNFSLPQTTRVGGSLCLSC